MFAFDAPLFWYRLVFLTELLLAEGLATYTLNKRSRFALRVAGSILGCYVLTFLLPLIVSSAVYISFMFLAQFAFTVAAMKLCYFESTLNLIFCGVIAYTTQHIAYQIYSMAVSVSGLSDVSLAYGADVTGSDPALGHGEYNVFTALIYAGVYFLVYWFIWAFIERRIRLNEDLRINNVYLFLLVAVIVAVDIVLNAIVMYMPYKYTAQPMYLINSIYNILSCILAMGMQFSMLGKRLAEKELGTIKQLWAQDRKAYELSKENIELINVKCHDLKRQIRALRVGSGVIDKDALAEIESAVNIYDGAVKTGSDVLDVILAEKSLYCEKHGIKFTCMADGEKLSFMSPYDIYSLFENAATNAIEAVSKVCDPEKRIIKLRIAAKGDMLSVHMENFFAANDLVFVNGLPKTTKGDSKWHGFGVRSMQLIAEKYDGALTAAVEDGMFELDILIPIKNHLGNNTD